MPKVSVIIPVYGVEKYIERCARSLFEQTLEDMEFIFVDDCTKDNSIEILKQTIKEYPNRQTQIKIVRHEINKGLPQARTTGLGYVTGEYVAHCDSDDWVDITMYEKLYNKATNDNLDIVICHFYHSDGITHTEHIHNDTSIDKTALYFEYINLWVKLVRRNIYTDNEYMPVLGAMLEDRALSVQLTYYSNRIGILDEPLYYYFRNNGSICHVFDEHNIVARYEAAVKNVNLIISFLKSKEIADDYPTEITKLKFIARHQIAPITNKRKYYKLWASTFPEINRAMLYDHKIPASQRIRFILTSLGLFSLLRSYLSK